MQLVRFLSLSLSLSLGIYLCAYAREMIVTSHDNFYTYIGACSSAVWIVSLKSLWDKKPGVASGLLFYISVLVFLLGCCLTYLHL